MRLSGLESFGGFDTLGMESSAPANILDTVDWYVVAKETGINLLSNSVSMNSEFIAKSNVTYNDETTKLTENTATSEHWIGETVGPTVTGGLPYTLSVEASASERTQIVLRTSPTALGNRDTWFDLNSGTVGTQEHPSASIASVGDGWYRCSITLTPTQNTTSPDWYIKMGSGSNETSVYTGDGTSGVFLRNPQWEQSSTFTTYEETTGNLVAMRDQRNGNRHVYYPGGTNNPVYLEYSGSAYIWFPGTDNNVLSVPDNTGIDVSGDIDLIVKIEPTTFATGLNQFFFWKDRGGGAYDYAFGLTSIGRGWFLCSDGVSSFNTQATVDFSGLLWLRTTYRASDGRVQFFESSDGTSWSQVGSDRSVAANALAQTGLPLYIGNSAAATQGVEGKLYRAIIKDGIDGTVVLDVNAEDADPNSNTFNEASSNNALVTINRSTSGYQTDLVVQPQYKFSTDDYLFSPDVDDFFDVGADDDFTVVGVFKKHQTYVINEAMITKRGSNAWSLPGWYIGVTSAGGNTGIWLSSAESFSNQSFYYKPGFQIDKFNIVGGRLQAGVSGSFYVSGSNPNSAESGPDTTSGSLANNYDLRIGSSGIGGAFFNGVFVGAAFVKSYLTEDQMQQIGEALITANGGTP